MDEWLPETKKYRYYTIARQLLEARQHDVTKNGVRHAHFTCRGRVFIKLKHVFLSDRDFAAYLGFLPLPVEGASVLEVGCGTGWGICTLYLDNKASIKRLVACDINPNAVENARLNLQKHGIPGDAIVSDVFDGVSGNEKFDLIFWNVPFYLVPEKEKLSLLDRSIADAGYAAIERYIRDCELHLTSRGKAAILFSPECGDPQLLARLAEIHGKSLELVWRSRIGGGLHNYDITFELYLVKSKESGGGGSSRDQFQPDA